MSDIEIKGAHLEEIDRNARAYGYEIGRGAPLVAVVESSDDNPFLDPNWRGQVDGDTKTNIVVGSREWMVSACEGRHPSVAQVLKHFAYSHLPEKLQAISKNCANLALQMCAMIADDPELVVGLRKLLEAKDCFVRAALSGE